MSNVIVLKSLKNINESVTSLIRGYMIDNQQEKHDVDSICFGMYPITRRLEKLDGYYGETTIFLDVFHNENHCFESRVNEDGFSDFTIMFLTVLVNDLMVKEGELEQRLSVIESALIARGF